MRRFGLFGRCNAMLFACLITCAFTSCTGTGPVSLKGGTLDLNPRMRGDLGPSHGMPNGRFFSDGSCTSEDPMDECRFISPLRTSTMTSIQLQRMRRSSFLWVEGDGFPILSYEFAGRGVDIFDEDEDPPLRIADDVDFGLCWWGHLAADPETRRPVPGTEGRFIANPDEFSGMMDVSLRECVSLPAAVSESLDPATWSCVEESIRRMMSPRRRHLTQEAPPICLINQPVSGRYFGDISYSLIPVSSAGIDITRWWHDVALPTLPVLPHLKTIPVDGIRTISRKMDFLGPETEPMTGMQRLVWRWQVPIEEQKDLWTENFSPNIFVTKARVRRGPFAQREYLPVQRLDVGGTNCNKRITEGEFDISICRDDREGVPFRVTPAYSSEAIGISRVDDGGRITWLARLRVDDITPALTPEDRLYLEMDLTAVSPIAVSGAKLVAAPMSRDIGEQRVGPGAALGPLFTLRNFGATNSWIDHILLDGRNAAEFGTVELRQVSSQPPELLSVPFVLRPASSVDISLTPAFSTAGEKIATLVIAFRDVRNQQGTLTLGLKAHALSPSLYLLPEQLIFTLSSSTRLIERAAILSNDGGLPFERRTLSITGSGRDHFRILGYPFLAHPQTIGPGASETYYFLYVPQSEGDHQARIVIDTSEGQTGIDLFGTCHEDCEPPRIRTGEGLRPEVIDVPPVLAPERSTR